MIMRSIISLAIAFSIATPAVAQGPKDGFGILLSGRYLEGVQRLRRAANSGDQAAAGLLAQFEPTITGFPRRIADTTLPLVHPEARATSVVPIFMMRLEKLSLVLARREL